MRALTILLALTLCALLSPSVGAAAPTVVLVRHAENCRYDDLLVLRLGAGAPVAVAGRYGQPSTGC